MARKVSVNRNVSADEERAPLPGFGERVAERRKSLGLTQTELAERIGRAVSAVTAWENSKRPPDGGHMLARLAAELETSVDYLLTGQRANGVEYLIAELEDLLADAKRALVGGAPRRSEHEIPAADSGFPLLPPSGTAKAEGEG